MRIQTFKDGDRFVVIFEGLENAEVEEKMINGLLNAITPVQIEDRPCEVAPLPYDEGDAPEPPFVFPDGEYAGQSVTDVLMAEPKVSQDAYRYICSQLRTKAWSENLSKSMKEAIGDYLRNRFKDTDAAEYSKKLSDTQVKVFYDTFGYSLPKDLKPCRENLEEAIKTLRQ